MLLPRAALNEIQAGRIDRAFRRWKRPTVRAGGTLRTSIGLLAIDCVEPITDADVTEEDARHAGFASREALFAFLPVRDEQLYRIRLRTGGVDPRAALREQATLTPGGSRDLHARLARLDARSPDGPWTAATLAAIAARRHPRGRPGGIARARAAAVQGRRAEAEGARPDREPRGRLPHLAARSGAPRRRMTVGAGATAVPNREVRLAESRYRIRNSRRSSLGSKTFTIGGGKTATVAQAVRGEPAAAEALARAAGHRHAHRPRQRSRRLPDGEADDPPRSGAADAARHR